MTVDEAIEDIKEAVQPFVGGKSLEMAIQALEEIQQYRAIGTVEECRTAVERMKPKKPIYSKFDDNGFDEVIPYKAECPICGHEFEFGTWNDEENHHCVCGQAIDWSYFTNF